MEKIKIEREAIVLDAEEKKRLIILLQYCRHRILDHADETGLHQHKWAESFTEYMLKIL
jgi:hypothetical protein